MKEDEAEVFSFDPNTYQVSIPELYVPGGIEVRAYKRRRRSTTICIETSEPHPYKDAVLKPAGAKWDGIVWVIEPENIPALIELSKIWAEKRREAGITDYKKGI